MDKFIIVLLVKFYSMPHTFIKVFPVKVLCYMVTVYTLSTLILLCAPLQEIERDSEKKGTPYCKMELYRKFSKCGEYTWQRVIEALQKSGQKCIADEVCKKLIKDFSTC